MREVRFKSLLPQAGHLPGISTTIGMVKVHSGKPGQARKRPNLPDLYTRFRPQTGQTSSETSSGTFILWPSMAFSASCSSFSKPP